MKNKILKQYLELINSKKIFKKGGNLGSSNKLKFYLNKLFDNIDLKDKTILDIGAGTGLITEGLVQKGLKVIAVDQSEVMIEEMKRKFGFQESLICIMINNIMEGKKIST